MKTNQTKERLTHIHNAEVPNTAIKDENFDIFNNNSNFFKTSSFSNFMTGSMCTSIIRQFFYDKIKFPYLYFTNTQNKPFAISILIENNLTKQTLNRYHGNMSLIQRKFLFFPLMRNDKTDRPFKFNAIVRLTAVFSMISAVYVNFYQKKSVTAQKLFLTKYALKTNEKKKDKNVLIFVVFFMNSFQLFYDNSTLTIISSNDFNVINQYKNDTKFIIIGEGIYSIPGISFSGWSSVISVDFGKSVSDIAGSVFSSCLSLEIIIFGENVTTIGGSAFSLCSSIKNITIPNSVTAIGDYVFGLCSNLIILTLGYGIKEIGNSAFGNCYNLQCIYYYGETEPSIGESAFYNVTATVITYPTYVDEKFGNLEVVQSVEGNCNPISTISFSVSHTFSRSDTYSVSNTFSLFNTYSAPHTFIQSNTFSKSFAFTESLQNDLTKTFSYLLTFTLSITHSFTYYEIQTKTISLITINSSYIYIETEFIYYDYTVIIYSTYYNYYSNFFTFIYRNEIQTNDNKTKIITIIVCVIVVVIIIISLLIVLLIRIKNQKEEIDENEISEQQSDNQTANTFTTGISISNIEEDPFADDFKEEKFIEQM